MRLGEAKAPVMDTLIATAPTALGKLGGVFLGSYLQQPGS